MDLQPGVRGGSEAQSTLPGRIGVIGLLLLLVVGVPAAASAIPPPLPSVGQPQPRQVQAPPPLPKPTTAPGQAVSPGLDTPPPDPELPAPAQTLDAVTEVEPPPLPSPVAGLVHQAGEPVSALVEAPALPPAAIRHEAPAPAAPAETSPRGGPPAAGSPPEGHIGAPPSMGADYFAVGDRVLSTAGNAANVASGQPLLMGVGQTLVSVYPVSAISLLLAALFLMGLVRRGRVEGHLRTDVATSDQELEFT